MSPDPGGTESPLSESSEESVSSGVLYFLTIMQLMFHYIVTWASDHHFRFLSSFTQWVDSSPFFPVPSLKMQIDIDYVKSQRLPFRSNCGECTQLFEESGCIRFDKVRRMEGWIIF